MVVTELPTLEQHTVAVAVELFSDKAITVTKEQVDLAGLVEAVLAEQQTPLESMEQQIQVAEVALLVGLILILPQRVVKVVQVVL
jgi:hypothetical protein